MSEKNKTTVHRWVVDGFNTGDPAIADEIIDPSFNYHHSGLPPVPSGPEGYKQLVAMYRGAFPDLNITMEDMVVEGEKVSVRLTGTGTNKGEFRGIPPTNKKVTVSMIDIYHISEGKFVEGWSRYDTLGMMRQLGLIPTSGKGR